MGQVVRKSRSYLRSVRLRVADVNQVLTSEADICSRGYQVVLGHGEGASHIEDLATINLRQQDGVCRHELIVTQLLGFSSCKPQSGGGRTSQNGFWQMEKKAWFLRSWKKKRRSQLEVMRTKDDQSSPSTS